MNSVTIDGRTYTRQQFNKAKETGIIRWAMRAAGKEAEGACSFCILMRNKFGCGECPILGHPTNCCEEYDAWNKVTKPNPLTQRDLSLGISEALAVLDRIRALDFDKWAAKYVELEKTKSPKSRVTITQEQAEAVKEAWMKAIKLPGALPSNSAVSKAIDSLVAPEPVKQEQKWNVGDWVYHNLYGIGKITYSDDSIHQDGAFTRINGALYLVDWKDVRPLTDADWTGQIAGVPVRAYVDDEEDILLKLPFDHDGVGLPWGNDDSRKVARAICAAFNLPIMPYELSEGDYKKPEVKR